MQEFFELADEDQHAFVAEVLGLPAEHVLTVEPHKDPTDNRPQVKVTHIHGAVYHLDFDETAAEDPAAEATDIPAEDDLAALSAKQLKDLAGAYGLPKNGSKETLIARIETELAELEADETDDDTAPAPATAT